MSKASWSVCPFSLTLETDVKHGPRLRLEDTNSLPLVAVLYPFLLCAGAPSVHDNAWPVFSWKLLLSLFFFYSWAAFYMRDSDWLNHVCCFYLLLSFCTSPLPLTQPMIWELGMVSEQLRRRRNTSWRIFSNNNVLVVDYFLYVVAFQTFWRLDLFLSVHTSD